MLLRDGYKSLSTENILELYNKYAKDLRETIKKQREFYRRYNVKWYQKNLFLNYMLYHNKNYKVWADTKNDKKARVMPPSFNDIEAEITYLLVREFKPQNVIDISPASGWSSSWILSALKDNGSGFLTSFDLVDDSELMLNPELTENRWKLIRGDVKQKKSFFPSDIDYLFLDSDHSASFANWYIEHIFPLIKPGIPVSIHDIYIRKKVYGEIPVVLNWLIKKKIRYVTPSKFAGKSINVRSRILGARRKTGIKGSISSSKIDSAIFFLMT